MLKLRQLVDLYELLNVPAYGGHGTVKQVLLLAWRYRDIRRVEDMPDEVSAVAQASPSFGQTFWTAKSLIWLLPLEIQKKIAEILGY